MGNPIIFYGITNETASRLDKFVSITGEPVVFSTKDEEIKNYRGGDK